MKPNGQQLYFNVMPANMMYPYKRQEMAEEVRTQARTAYERNDKNGDLIPVAAAGIDPYALGLSRLKYGLENIWMHDIGCGLLSIITTGRAKGFNLDFEVLKNEEGKIRVWRVTASRETLRRCVMGPLLGMNGRAVTGAGDIADEVRRHLDPIFAGDAPEPLSYVSINQGKFKGILKAKPITIRASTADAVMLEVDNNFFEMKANKDGDYKTAGPYVCTIAGMGAVLQFGKKIAQDRGIVPPGETWPQMPSAHRLMLYIQTAFQIGTFRPTREIVFRGNNGRYNVNLKRDVAKYVYPECYDAKRGVNGWIEYKTFSNFVSSSGIMLATAIDETGIADKLPKEILIPARDRGAEFPNEKPGDGGRVYLKVDPLAELTDIGGRFNETTKEFEMPMMIGQGSDLMPWDKT